MNLSQIAVSLILLMSFSLTACGAEPPPPTPTPTPTKTPVALVTEPEQATAEVPEPVPTSTATLSPEPTATNTPVATPTPVALVTPTLTATLKIEPVVKLAEGSTTVINVRAGPGTNYPVVEQLEPGETALVTGENKAEDWWQIDLDPAPEVEVTGWVFAALVVLTGDGAEIPLVEAPPPPTPDPTAVAAAEANEAEASDQAEPSTPEDLADQLRCGKDFCVTYQAMVPIWENGGCIGNHSIFVTVLEGPPPGRPMDGVVIGDTFGNIEVASGDKGPGTAEVTLWMNSMSLKIKRHIDGTPYTSEESFSFTSHDELIPAEVLAAAGYCGGNAEECRVRQNQNQVCRGHYSWRVTFHKFD